MTHPRYCGWLLLRITVPGVLLIPNIELGKLHYDDSGDFGKGGNRELSNIGIGRLGVGY